jgi:porin
VFLLQTRFPRLANPGPVLANILQRFFPALLVPALPPNHESSSWALSYSFDQYFWQPDGDPRHGIGLFFGFGASDGNPNPIQYSFITGIGGKGVVASRPDDTFGLGVARTQFSNAFVPLLRQQLKLGLRREDAIEMYYNVSVTQWLNLTADLQIIGPGTKKALNAVGQLANVDTAVVAGARLGHAALWETLNAWADLARDQERWRERVIRRARRGPHVLQPHERGQVVLAGECLAVGGEDE